MHHLSLRQQIRARRKALGLTQKEMESRTGMLRQQYQRIEAQGNPRLDLLETISSGLNSELVLVPREHLHQVLQILAGQAVVVPSEEDFDPWKGLLEEPLE